MGVAFIDGEKIVKPWPDNIDEWTHYLHDPGNNAIADDDVIAPPKGLQWVAGPLWSRSHTTLAGTTCAVSARGRIFCIEDRAPIQMGRMPAQVLIDKSGRIRYRHFGNSMADITDNRQILALLDELNQEVEIESRKIYA